MKSKSVSDFIRNQSSKEALDLGDPLARIEMGDVIKYKKMQPMGWGPMFKEFSGVVTGFYEDKWPKKILKHPVHGGNFDVEGGEIKRYEIIGIIKKNGKEIEITG